METNSPEGSNIGANVAEPNRQAEIRSLALRWAITILAGIAIYLAPTPEGVTPQSWRLLAIFAATIVGSIVRPVPGGAMVLLGIAALMITKAMPVSEALAQRLRWRMVGCCRTCSCR